MTDYKDDMQLIYEEYCKLIQEKALDKIDKNTIEKLNLKAIKEDIKKTSTDNSKYNVIIYERNNIKFAICSEKLDDDIRTMKAFESVSHVLSNDIANIKLLAVESFLNDKNWHGVDSSDELKECLIVDDTGKVLQNPISEKAPPSKKAERMVKHIKKSAKESGKDDKEAKKIAYATAWKAHKKGKV